jgi:hypothetical protein
MTTVFGCSQGQGITSGALPFPLGEPKPPIDKRHCGALVFYPEVALALMGRFRVGVMLASLPPAVHLCRYALGVPDRRS